MESNVISEQSLPEASNIVEPRGHNDNPAANTHKEQEAPEVKEDKPSKPESRMDTIKRAMSDIEGKNKPEDKNAEKAEVKADEKAELKDNKAPAEKPEARAEPEAQKPLKPSEGQKHHEAPARFLPRAKELWVNTPKEVKAEYARMQEEHTAATAQFQEAKTFRDELSDYDRMAKANNTSIKASLDNYTAIERKFAEDPAQGFRAIMQNMNFSPPQAISHILRAFNVTPQQLADHIQRDPNAYTALAPQRQMQPQQQFQPQAAQQQVDPQIKALQEQVARMQADSVANQVIAPFANEYPEYYQHEDAIAKVLQSGIIDQIHGSSLSPRDKLEAALFMVAPHVKRAPQEQSFQAQPVRQAEDDTPALDVRGNKSIKGAPYPGTDGSSRRRGNMSREDAFNAAWSELGLR